MPIACGRRKSEPDDRAWSSLTSRSRSRVLWHSYCSARRSEERCATVCHRIPLSKETDARSLRDKYEISNIVDATPHVSLGRAGAVAHRSLRRSYWSQHRRGRRGRYGHGRHIEHGVPQPATLCSRWTAHGTRRLQRGLYDILSCCSPPNCSSGLRKQPPTPQRNWLFGERVRRLSARFRLHRAFLRSLRPRCGRAGSPIL